MNKARLRPNGVVVKVSHKTEDSMHLFFIGPNNNIVDIPSVVLEDRKRAYDKLKYNQIQFVYTKAEPKEGYKKEDISFETTEDFNKVNYAIRDLQKLNVTCKDDENVTVHDLMMDKGFCPFIQEFMDEWYPRKKTDKIKDNIKNGGEK